jgi:hypothetical protein
MTVRTASNGAGLRSAREVTSAPSVPAITASPSSRADGPSRPKFSRWETMRSVIDVKACRLATPAPSDSCSAASVTSGAIPQPRE